MMGNLATFNVDPIFIFQSLASNGDDYIYLWNCKDESYIISANFAEDFNMPIEGNDFSEQMLMRIYANDLERVTATFHNEIVQQKTGIVMEFQFVNANQQYVWVKNRSTVQYDESGEPSIIIGVLHNLSFDGIVDTVTGLLINKKCEEIFELTVGNHLQSFGSVMFLGIDEFASINTLNNHLFGDSVLRNTVQDILTMLPEQVSIYRYDGDQFILLAEKMRKDEMYDLYEKIKSYTSNAHTLNGIHYRFTISAGIACYPEDGGTWNDIEKAVSIALKEAKRKGKNRCIEFTPEMLEMRLYEQTLSQSLANSVEHDFAGFKVVFQPVCYTQSLKVKGAEVLLRFETSPNQYVSPLEFIPLLEQSQLIIPVGFWVLEQAIATCKEWVKSCPEFVMNVNVSYIQLRDTTFCDMVEVLLHKYALDTKHLTLELTESYFISDAKNINISLQRLQALHLQVAMDDFGTGYSSLARLAEFNVDVVKIDRSFVQSLHKSKYNHDFVDAVVRLCHNIGMKVCVEGVETREEQASISLLNVDYIQGFYVSKPISKKAFFDRFLHQPYASEELVVKPDMRLHNERIVKDQSVLLAMMDACPLALNFWNRDFEIVACNEEVLNLFKVSNLNEFKRRFFEFSPTLQEDGVPSQTKARHLIEGAFSGKTIKSFWQHQLEGGESIPTEVTLVRIPYMNDYIVASYTRDMRDQIKMEEQIKQFNQRMLAILNALPLCLNLWNNKYENIMCNKEAVTLFNLKSEAEYTENFFALSPTYQPDGQLSNEKAIVKINEAFVSGRSQFFWMHQDLEGNKIPSEITLVEIDSLDEDGGSLVAGYTRDLTEQWNAEKIRMQASARIQGVLDSMPLSCVLWSLEQKIIDCNQSIVNLFQAKSKRDIAEHFYDFFPTKQPDGAISMVKKDEKFSQAFQNGICIFEWVYQTRNGETIPCEVTLTKLMLENEEIFVAYSRDLREIHNTLELNDRLSKLAYYDLLTGVPSRLKFMQKLEENFKRYKVDDYFALVIFDLDYFKSVNDTYGHAMGDLVLRKVVKCVDEFLPNNSVLGRFGGDEFMIQFIGLKPEELAKFLEVLVVKVSEIKFTHEEVSFVSTISAGGSFKNKEDKTYNDLLKRADKILYEVKEGGRNRSLIK